MKIALIGYGKMGRLIEQQALQRGHTVASIIDIGTPQDFQGEAFRSADVAIEFTTPQAAYGNILQAFQAGLKVVTGSTGWQHDHLDDIRRLTSPGQGHTLFWSSNFSLGVYLFDLVNRYLARLMAGRPEYNVSMEETHHVHKLDAPSGTAITLARHLMQEYPGKTEWVAGTFTAPDGTVTPPAQPLQPSQIPISSARRGEVPGIHSITYDSPADSITITHSAHNRTGFALGAVLAAEYTHTHQGLLNMDDLFAQLIPQTPSHD